MTRKEREAKAEVIVRLRSQLEWPWDKIAAYVGYHRKSCQRIFREACKRSDGSYVLEEERKRYFKLFDEAHELIDELLSSAFLVRGDPRVAILKQKIDLLRLHATVLGLGRQPAD